MTSNREEKQSSRAAAGGTQLRDREAAALLQIGDYLVVGDGRGDPHIIVYDLAWGVPIQRLGRSGRGPGEIADL